MFVFLEVRFRIRVLSNLHKSQSLRVCLPKERPVILDQKVNMILCDLKAFSLCISFDPKGSFIFFTIYQISNWSQLVSWASKLKKSRTLQLL